MQKLEKDDEDDEDSKKVKVKTSPAKVLKPKSAAIELTLDQGSLIISTLASLAATQDSVLDVTKDIKTYRNSSVARAKH